MAAAVEAGPVGLDGITVGVHETKGGSGESEAAATAADYHHGSQANAHWVKLRTARVFTSKTNAASKISFEAEHIVEEMPDVSTLKTNYKNKYLLLRPKDGAPKKLYFIEYNRGLVSKKEVSIENWEIFENGLSEEGKIKSFTKKAMLALIAASNPTEASKKEARARLEKAIGALPAQFKGADRGLAALTELNREPLEASVTVSPEVIAHLVELAVREKSTPTPPDLQKAAETFLLHLHKLSLEKATCIVRAIYKTTGHWLKEANTVDGLLVAFKTEGAEERATSFGIAGKHNLCKRMQKLAEKHFSREFFYFQGASPIKTRENNAAFLPPRFEAAEAFIVDTLAEVQTAELTRRADVTAVLQYVVQQDKAFYEYWQGPALVVEAVPSEVPAPTSSTASSPSEKWVGAGVEKVRVVPLTQDLLDNLKRRGFKIATRDLDKATIEENGVYYTHNPCAWISAVEVPRKNAVYVNPENGDLYIGEHGRLSVADGSSYAEVIEETFREFPPPSEQNVLAHYEKEKAATQAARPIAVTFAASLAGVQVTARNLDADTPADADQPCCIIS